jgi:hypothetical protein
MPLLLPQTAVDRDELFEELEDLFNRFATAKDMESEAFLKESIFAYLDQAVRKTDFSLEPKGT